MAASGRVPPRGFHPTAICGIFGATAAAARLRGLSTPRRRRARSGSPAACACGPLRLPRRRDRDEADPPGLGGARRAARGAARGARRRGPARACSRAASASTTPSSARTARSTSTPARRPRRALGDAADRLQAVPGLPLHPRLARRDRARSRPRSTRTRSRTSLVCDPGGGRLARARAGRAKVGAAHRLRGEVQPPVLDRGDARARPRRPGRRTRPEAIADPRVLELAREGALRDEGVRVLPGGVPGRRADHDCATAACSRPTSRYQRGGAREPDDATTRCAAKFRENAALALAPRSVEALEEAILALEDARRRARRPVAARAAAAVAA